MPYLWRAFTNYHNTLRISPKETHDVVCVVASRPNGCFQHHQELAYIIPKPETCKPIKKILQLVHTQRLAERHLRDIDDVSYRWLELHASQEKNSPLSRRKPKVSEYLLCMEALYVRTFRCRRNDPVPITVWKTSGNKNLFLHFLHLQAHSEWKHFGWPSLMRYVFSHFQVCSFIRLSWYAITNLRICWYNFVMGRRNTHFRRPRPSSVQGKCSAMTAALHRPIPPRVMSLDAWSHPNLVFRHPSALFAVF